MYFNWNVLFSVGFTHVWWIVDFVYFWGSTLKKIIYFNKTSNNTHMYTMVLINSGVYLHADTIELGQLGDEVTRKKFELSK